MVTNFPHCYEQLGIHVSIDDAARQQHGIITRKQAIAYGMTARQVDYRVARGTWIRRFSGVYQLRSSPVTWESRLLSAVFASGGIASHRCAAALLKLDVFYEPDVEISVATDRAHDFDGVNVHRTSQWGRRDPIVRHGIPCTGVERTILDCAGVLRLETVERLAEAAIRQGRTTWLDLADCPREHSRKGRNGCGTLRLLLQMRLEDRTVPLSDFSRRVVQLLVDSGLPRPVIEYRISDSNDQFIMQADLAWHAHKKAWELDGLQWHFGRLDVERDRRKRNRAKSEGWTIQEILWSMYVDSPDQLVQMARKFLDA